MYLTWDQIGAIVIVALSLGSLAGAWLQRSGTHQPINQRGGRIVWIDGYPYFERWSA
jgi:hypothetical protein